METNRRSPAGPRAAKPADMRIHSGTSPLPISASTVKRAALAARQSLPHRECLDPAARPHHLRRGGAAAPRLRAASTSIRYAHREGVTGSPPRWRAVRFAGRDARHGHLRRCRRGLADELRMEAPCEAGRRRASCSISSAGTGPGPRRVDEDPDDPLSHRQARVVPFVFDTKNCLIVDIPEVRQDAIR
jgi:hypothetical protein